MPFSPADKREHLIRPWSLTLMVLAVLGVLALLMPRNSFVVSPGMMGKPDALSVAYLQALLRADPGNDEIRALYAEHLAGTGRIDEADRQLQALKASAAANSPRLAYLTLRIAIERLLKHPDDPELRQRVRQLLARAFRLPGDRISPAQWEQLAGLLLQVNMPEQAAASYVRLAGLDTARRAQWLAKASRWYVAAGHPDKAAAVQLQLAALTGRAEDARLAIAYFLAARQADRAVRAMPDILDRFPEDRELLLKGMDAAMAARQFRPAGNWAHDWLDRHPDDTVMMQALIRLELASGHPEKAYRWAKRMVELHPDDIQLHAQLARIADWSGDTKQSFAQWQWLVEHRHERQDMKRALELADALHDYPSVNRLLSEAASQYGLSREESSDLAKVQEKLGNPQQSEQDRIAYLKKSPRDRAAWEDLAMLREYIGKLGESADTWKEIERRFGRNEKSATNRARMLSLTGKPEEGLSLMRDYAATGKPRSDRFWKVYGDLAWNLEYHDDAMAAYRWLWDHDQAQGLEAQRLMILLREEGDLATTLKISKQAWNRFHDPDVLLLAIESAIQVGRWQDVDQLMHIADRQPSLFRDRPRYWLAHARWMVHLNRLDAAEHDDYAALKLSPGNVEARTGLIWTWIQADRRDKLSRHLALWRSDAIRQEAYWQPYAAGYRQLGQTRASLPWFRKSAEAHPDDILWMLEYADALDKSGQASGAWRLRRYLFVKLWPKSRLHSDYARQNDKATLKAIAMLKRRLQGLPQADAWVKPMIAHADDPVVREFAIRWYFGIGRDSLATRWLMRQHAARLQLPAWQQLAVAMQHNDLDRIEQIIDHDSGIDHASLLLANRQLNRLDDAWVLAMDDGLGAGRFSAVERTTMLRQARELDALSPNALHAGFSFDHLGPLSLDQWGFKGFYSRNNRTISLKGTRAGLHTRTGFANLTGATTDYELQLAAGFRFPRGDWMFYGGSNQRRGGVLDTNRLLQWGGSVHLHPWQGGEAGMQLATHETSPETPAFRLVGARDRMQLSLSSDLTNREYVATSLNLNRYRTRTGDPIARGYSLDATLGHRLQLASSLSEEQMQLRLSGELASNRLQPALSPYASRMLPGATVSTVIPANFSSLGVGFNIQRGLPGNDEAVARTPVYLFDTWLGWQWPGSSPAYSVNIGLGMPVFGRDMVSLKAYLANNAPGSISNDALYGVALWYSYRLGR